ncbi:MAG: efflux RND transporter periplasmic adaptor subunit [Candidatus Aminicenantes bacterium]|nr:efflux RND transporter periplasmic adaptor subunit [Candidatus Aminicenantes bacterium]
MGMKSSKKKWFIGIAAVLVIAALVWFFTRNGKEVLGKYTMVKIDRGDLEAVVSSTGTLGAVTTVQVGTQVSGRIAKLYTDFNQTVKKGQLLAMLDTSSLLMAVSEAESSYEKARAQLKQNKQDLDRMQYLFKENIKTKNDLEQAQVNYELGQATLKSAQSGLERTRINLSYASIYAPIDGIVISRNIDVGQTVAASFSSPTLFLIANDLSKMQILANVDESDIGQIKEGQEVRFTVQAQTDKKFSGVVSQIRLEPVTIQNVVNYTVVINVANEGGMLLPGMTATIDFLVGQAKNVLRVANAALRLKPSQEMVQELMKQFQARFGGAAGRTGAGAMPAGTGAANGGGFPGAGANGTRKRPKDVGMLWILDNDGKPKPIRVKTGISDGQMTEIRASDISEGMEVIKSINLSPEEQAAQQGPPRMRIL